MSSTGFTTEKNWDLYREIFRHATEASAIIDPQGRYVEQNAAHAALLGYTDDELRNQPQASNMDDVTFAEVVNAAAEKGVYRSDVTNRTKNGELKNIEQSAFAIRGESGEPICYVISKRDITEQMHNESRLTLQYDNQTPSESSDL